MIVASLVLEVLVKTNADLEIFGDAVRIVATGLPNDIRPEYPECTRDEKQRSEPIEAEPAGIERPKLLHGLQLDKRVVGKTHHTVGRVTRMAAWRVIRDSFR